MRTYVGMNVQIQVYLSSEIDGCEWSASRPGRYTLGEGAPVSIRTKYVTKNNTTENKTELYSNWW
jgi:hypothetical protein